MKLTPFLIVLITLIACNNDKAANTSLKTVKAAPVKTAVKSAAVVIPVVKYGIEGFYTGSFVAKIYKEEKEIFNNKITICIDSLDERMIYGHSVVAGSSRPFEGSYKKQNNTYTIEVTEPGDHKYDGSFSFTIDKENGKLEGNWTAKDQTLAVTEREFTLRPRKYKYDPASDLPEEIVYAMVHGTYNEKTEKGETITEDVLKKNASTTLLKAKDVENMYKADLEVLRNSIYARHGYSFKNPRMRTLFDNAVEWYMPVTTDVTALLTETEKKNIALIKRYEKHAEKYYDEFGR